MNGLKICENGDKQWYKYNQLHRDDGPAVCEATTRQGVIVESVDGYKAWYKMGIQHRDGGPAVCEAKA